MTEPATTAAPSGARPRVVLGVSGGIAAYKACELLRRFTESGHDVTVVPTAAALRFVGAPDLGGAVRQAGQRRRVDRRPRGAARADRPDGRPGRGGARHRRPAGQGRPRPGRRPAHEHPADGSLPGGVRARDAHRDVGAPRDAGQRRHPARARRGRPRARRGPPDRRRHRQGPAARARARSSRLVLEVLAGSTRARSGRPRGRDLAGRHVVVSAGGTREPLDPVRFLGNRSSGRQGYALARTAAARGAEVTLVAANVEPARPGRGQGRARRDDRAAARRGGGRRRGRRRRRDGRGTGRLPPALGQRRQDQEGRRRLRPDRSSWCRTPTSWPSWRTTGSAPARSWSASPPRPATRRARCSTSPAPSSPARAATCWSSTTSAGERCSASTDNEAVILAADGEQRRRAARVEVGAGPRRSGTRSRRRFGDSRPASLHPGRPVT